MLFLLFSKHLPEEAGSGFSDYGLSATPRYSWDPWSLVGGGVNLFFSPCSVRRGTRWVEETSAKPSELSFSSEVVDLALVGSFPQM